MQTNNKLREALETLLNLAYEVQDANSEYGPKTSVPTQFVIDVAKSALAEPVKNCEVGTAGEQLKRFKDFCRIISKDETCDGCPLLPQCSTLEHCTLKWAQMPYEESDNKMKNESPAKPKVLVIDDAGYMGSYAQKFLGFCDVKQEYRIPEDETVLAKYDVLIVDGDGIGNTRYKHGIEFCKAYEKQGNNKGLIYHSGLMPDRADREILKERGIKMLLKGDVPGKFVAAVKEIV